MKLLFVLVALSGLVPTTLSEVFYVAVSREQYDLIQQAINITALDTNECGLNDSSLSNIILYNETVGDHTAQLGNGTVLNNSSDLFAKATDGVFKFRLDSDQQHNCSNTCHNTDGGFVCSCPTGYTLINSSSCEETDECSESSHACSEYANCTNQVGSYVCVCRSGFIGDGQNCTDIDECANGTDDCGGNATCSNTPGTYSCACDSGYAGDGYNCSDIDECANNSTNDCSQYANCTNSIGGYSCACNGNYTGNGFVCSLVDECLNTTLNNCSTNADCFDTEASYNCVCREPFVGDGFTCQNCTELGCTTNAECPDSTCVCKEGYVGDGTTICISEDQEINVNLTNHSSVMNITVVSQQTYQSYFSLFTTNYTAAVEASKTNSSMRELYQFLLQSCKAVREALVSASAIDDADGAACRPSSIKSGSVVVVMDISTENVSANFNLTYVLETACNGMPNTTACDGYDECLYGEDTCTTVQACIDTAGSYDCIDKCPTCCSKSMHEMSFNLTEVPAHHNVTSGIYRVHCTQITDAVIQGLLFAHDALADNGTEVSTRVCDIESLNFFLADDNITCDDTADESTMSSTVTIGIRVTLRYHGSAILTSEQARIGLGKAMEDNDQLKCYTYECSYKVANSTVEDVNECDNSNAYHTCDESATCNNTDGSYNCTCLDSPIFYYGDGETCHKATNLICNPTKITFMILEDYAQSLGLEMGVMHFGTGSTYANGDCMTGVNVTEDNATYWDFSTPEDFTLCGGTSTSEGNTVQVNVTITNDAANPNISWAGKKLDELLICDFQSSNFDITLNNNYSSTNHQVDISIPSQTGTITVSLQIYQNEDFTNPYDGVIQISSNQFLPVGVSIDTQSSNIYVVITELWASPSNDRSHPKKYSLIRERCPVDPDAVKIVEQGISKEAKIRLLAFNYIQEDGVYIFMIADIIASPLNLQCSSSRKRRAIEGRAANEPLERVVLAYEYAIRRGTGSPLNNPPVVVQPNGNEDNGIPKSNTTDTTPAPPLPETSTIEVWTIVVGVLVVLVLVAITAFVMRRVFRNQRDLKEMRVENIQAMEEHTKTLYDTHAQIKL